MVNQILRISGLVTGLTISNYSTFLLGYESAREEAKSIEKDKAFYLSQSGD